MVRAIHAAALLGPSVNGTDVMHIIACPDWKLTEAREAEAYCLPRKRLDLLQLAERVRRAAGELRA